MEPYIAISTINDFLYCPRSLYMHIAAGGINPASYHETPQVRGKAVHEAIEFGRYSNRKNVVQNMSIFSEELGIQGKLDTFDTTTGELIERKAKIKKLYEGYYMQLYAEYFCLVEMGYKPTRLAFYSMLDNKKYPIPIPTKKYRARLKQIISEIQNYTPQKLLKHTCPNCNNNIYTPLGW